MAQWTAVDFDGTLARYSAGQSGLGSPIPAMVERVIGWLAQGKEVRIFTARVAPDNGAEFIAEQTQAIGNWCQDHLGCRLDVTAIKDFGMIELYDDRAFHVEMNTGRLTDKAEPALGIRVVADPDIAPDTFYFVSPPHGYRILRTGEPIPMGAIFWHPAERMYVSFDSRGLLVPPNEIVAAPIQCVNELRAVKRALDPAICGDCGEDIRGRLFRENIEVPEAVPHIGDIKVCCDCGQDIRGRLVMQEPREPGDGVPFAGKFVDYPSLVLPAGKSGSVRIFHGADPKKAITPE
jgi:hypothetical protein